MGRSENSLHIVSAAMVKRSRNEELKETALKHLENHNTMTLATAHENRPWAATVFYANKGFTLYFLSDPASAQHCKNIAQNPYVSVTIDEDYPLKEADDWRKVKGIQMEGIARIITSEEDMAEAVRIYAGKYPFVAPYLKLIMSPFPRIVSFLDKLIKKLPLTPSFTAVSTTNFYQVVPTSVWFVDNEKSFERREEVKL